MRPIAKCAPDNSAVAFHDALAPEWDSKYESGGFRLRAEFFRREIMPFIGGKGCWLDAGCGTGHFARLLGGQGFRVAGVDASASMIEAAIKLADASSLAGALSFQLVRDLSQLPFADNSFAGCLCLSVLEYLDRPCESLDEFIRVVEPGGTLIVSVPSRYSAVRWLERILLRTRFPGMTLRLKYNKLSKHSATGSGLRDALSRRGLRVKTIVGFDPIIPRLMPRFATSLLFAVAVKIPIG